MLTPSEWVTTVTLAEKQTLGQEAHMAVGQNRSVPFWLVGEFTPHFRTYFSGFWDVHRGYDLGFDPRP